MSGSVQLASIAAWNDEKHVAENRRLYREKFAAFFDLVNPVLPLVHPEAAFYFRAAVPGDDESFARDLYATANVTVLPGSYLSRDAHGANPGRGHVRIALVATVDEAAEAGRRIRDFVRSRAPGAAPHRSPGLST
jgi:N-succinyldiaminopimelate aminotransferase